MVVIVQCNEQENFNGLVSIKRLSSQEVLQWDTYCLLFNLDYHANQLIVKWEWKNLYEDDTYIIDEISHLISNYHQLKEDVSDLLCF